MLIKTWIAGHKALSVGIAAAIAISSGAAAVVATQSGSSAASPPTRVVASPGDGNGLNATANGSATISWSAPTSGPTVTGYLVDINSTYTDRVPAPSLGNGGVQQYTLPASARSYTFVGLYQDCHERYRMSVTALSASGPSAPVFTQSFRPSGHVIPSQDPPYVVVLVDGIDSQQPGFQMNPYTPTTGPVQSYCPESWDPTLNNGNGGETEANFAKPYGLAPPNGPTGPWSFFHKWSHGETDENGSPTNGSSNLLYASEPKLLGGPGANGGPSSFTHTFLLDDIAARGAIILPFSYHSNLNCITSLQGSLNGIGAQVSGSVHNPTFSYPAYGKSDSDPIPIVNDPLQPCRGNINYWSQILEATLKSIHQTWPTSKLVVMGHSQGGLVVATAWQHGFGFDTSPTPVPVQAFSLDSPINGSCGTPACLGPPSYPDYNNRGTYDEGAGGYLGMDQSRGNNMHFIGTYGDSPAVVMPLHLFVFHAYGTGAETLEHQIPFWYSTQNPPSSGTYTSDYIEAHCNVMPGAVVNPQCPAPSPPDYISSCPVDYYSVAQWIVDTGHFVVKYCPGVINYFNSTLGLSPVTTSPSPPPSPTPSPPVGWPCTAKTFEQVLANPIETEVTPAGPPKCLDGYAVMNFNNPAGQPAPFFFEFSADKWSLIEGGNAVPTKACSVIPHQVMSAWGYNCSNPANNPTPSASSRSISPGHGSAAAAIAGLYQSELIGDWSATTGTCSYVQPDAQSTCASLEGGNGAATGNFHIAATVTQGNEALVEVTGAISAPGSPTVSNSNPTSGMPNTQADFSTTYDDLVNSSATIMSPAPAIEINGLWYAAIN
jgi:hypothetical protein